MNKLIVDNTITHRNKLETKHAATIGNKNMKKQRQTYISMEKTTLLEKKTHILGKKNDGISDLGK